MIHANSARFRWVVMSLEALCAMKNDYDILARLGKLPRKLAVLYKEIYDDLFMHSYDVGQPLIKNTFKWLLCIRDSMSSHEFLAAIAQTVSPAPATLTREELLDLCCSFVAYDTGRDRFEFAHPSVREFLEGLPDYARTSSHAAAAECCLVYMIGRAESLKARNFLSERYSFSETNDRSIRDSFYSHGFGVYAARYGMLHCSAAKSARNCEPLQPVLETFLMDDSGWQSPLSWWMKQKVPDALRSNSLLDSLTGQSNSLHRAFVVACTFGFSEIVAHHLYSSLPEHTREQALVMSTLSRQDLITLQLLKPTMRYISSRNVLQHLLNRHTKLHPKLHPQQRLDRHSENIVQLTLSHCHSVAIDEDIIIYLCYYFPSIAPGFLLQYIQSETGEKVLLRTMELRSDDRIVEVISSTLQITQKMLRSALRNPGLTKRSLNMLESHTGPVETSIGLLDSVATCKSQEVLDEIFLRQGSLITPTMIEGLLKNNINLLDTLLIRHPDIRVTQDLVEVLLNETSLDSVSVFDILTRHSRRACYLTDDMIHKLAILIGAKMKAERRLVEEKIRLASDQCTPSRPPSLFKEIYWETERRGASLSRELLSKWTGLCGMKILEVILDDGEAKSKPSLQIPSEQRPNTSGKSRVDCDRCYKEILITLIMKRAYHDCPINWQRNYLPQDINFHVARICNGALDGPSWRNISEGTLDFPELLWCSTWHSDHRSQPLLLQSSVSSTTRHRPPRVLLMGKSQTDEERKAEQPTETSSVS